MTYPASKLIKEVATVVLAICMLSIIGCSNDNDARVQELENPIKELQQAQSVSQTATPTSTAVATAVATPVLTSTPSPTFTPAPTPLPDYDEGTNAYWDEDYKTALALLTPLAEAGHAEAQEYLGRMYSDGKGVPANDKTAVEWYTLAAEQGHVYAQLYLGWSFPRSSKFGYM